MASSHRLAAIMFSDIVGYSATTQESEDEAVLQISRHKEVLEKFVPKYEGTILQYYGDGSLCIFPSAIDAVECALYIQSALELDQNLPLRIGIHLGEIFFEGDQFLGDGINIAARIQAEANEGEVLISHAVSTMISNKPDLEQKSIGFKTLKNIKSPVKLYRVGFKSSHQTSSRIFRHPAGLNKYGNLLWVVGILVAVIFLAVLFTKQLSAFSTGQQSIVILPFSSLSTDKDDVFFSEGIAENIRNKLAAINDLEVRSRASSEFVKEKGMSAREIAKALDIGYILEGSVQRVENVLRINLSLINAKEDLLLEPMQYETSDPGDIFQIQQRIAEMVIDLVNVNVNPRERELMTMLSTTNFEAHRNYILGRSYMLRSSSKDDLLKSEQYFRMAIKEDSLYAEAYAGLAEVLIWPAMWGYMPISEAMPEAKRHALKASELGPNLAEVQHVMGTVYELERKFDLAESSLRKAISTDPSHALSYLRLARIKLVRDDAEGAIRDASRAANLDPLSPIVGTLLPAIFSRLDQTDRAIASCKKALSTFPQDNSLLWQLGQAYILKGELSVGVDVLLSRSVETADKNFLLGYAYARAGDTSKANEILDYLLQKSDNAYVPPSMIASIYYGLDDLENTHLWLEKEENYYLLCFPFLKPLFANPKFADIYSFLDQN